MTRQEITDLMAEKVDLQMKLIVASTDLNAQATAIMDQARADVEALKAEQSREFSTIQARVKEIHTLLKGAF